VVNIPLPRVDWIELAGFDAVSDQASACSLRCAVCQANWPQPASAPRWAAFESSAWPTVVRWLISAALTSTDAWRATWDALV